MRPTRTPFPVLFLSKFLLFLLHFPFLFLLPFPYLPFPFPSPGAQATQNCGAEALVMQKRPPCPYSYFYPSPLQFLALQVPR